MVDPSIRLDPEDALHPISIIRNLDHPNIRHPEKAVLWAMASQLNLKKGRDTVFSSMSTIAKNAGMDESAARRIVNWFVSVGVLVEVDGPYRSKCRRIDFGQLVSLPTNGKRVRGVHVPGGQDVGHGAQALDTPARDDGPQALDTPARDVGAHKQALDTPARDVGAPKNDLKNKRRTNEEQTSARVPRRSSGTGGATLDLDFGLVDPPTPDLIAAPTPAPPERPTLSVNPLPVGTPDPPPKGKGKATKKHVRKFTDEQIEARDFVYAFWKKTYRENCGDIEPIVGNAEVGQMVNLLKKLNWDSRAVCNLISNAFADVFFRERIKTIGHIVANASKYQAPVTVPKKHASSAQIEPDASFWENRERYTMEDLGS